MDTSIGLETGDGFSLAEAGRFWLGFTPGRGTAEVAAETLTLVFRQDGDFAPVAVALRQAAPGAPLHGEVTGGDRRIVARQVARMLSLDVDTAPWREALARDPVIAGLQSRWPGFRAVGFPSPWEAAAWGVIVQGLGMASASRIKASIAAAHGDVVELHGRRHAVFP